jgi:DHA1 family multidrug/chloramphenicol efflux transport protein-like MFS transporter
MRPATVWKSYRAVFTNRGFLLGSAALSFAGMPLLAWIGQSPVIFIERLGMTPLKFGLLQIPIFASLIAGNISLSRRAGKLSTAHLIAGGTLPLLGGLALALALLVYPGAWVWLILSMSLYAYGMGMVNAVLYRLALYSSDVSKGTVSASLGMVMLFFYAAGIEVVKFGSVWGGNGWFTAACMVMGLAYWVAMRAFLKWSARGEAVL